MRLVFRTARNILLGRGSGQAILPKTGITPGELGDIIFFKNFKNRIAAINYLDTSLVPHTILT